MNSLSSIVREQIQRIGGGKRLTVGVIYRGDIDVALAAMTSAHRSVVLSDRFRALYSLYKRYQSIASTQKPQPVLLEANLKNLPLASHCLDILVLARGLPSINSDSPAGMLGNFKKLLVPGGALIWPHPIVEGFGGKMGRVLVPHRRGTYGPMERHRLCSLMMETGYGQVGQAVPKGGLIPWIVTTGKAGRI